MITLQKKPGKDFKILNLTDTQLASEEWAEGHKNRAILVNTVTQLVKDVDPDLITVTGDLAWAGEIEAYDGLADLLDSFERPWAPVWGNHDNQGGPEKIEALVERYLAHPFCIYEKGDPAIGNGNYVIAIEEEGRVVEGVIMMDSHDRMPYVNAEGKEEEAWAKIIPGQIEWYRAQVEMLNSLGCRDTTVMMHIPIYAYREAWNAAYKAEKDPVSIAPEQGADPSNWNEGYEGSFGVRYEGICSYPADEGMMDVIVDLGSTKHVVSGHDHVNSFVIPYRGVKLIYGLKTGAGCYWKPELNGGTVLRVTENGVEELWHQYVDVSGLL